MPYDTIDTRYNIPGLTAALTAARKKSSELSLGADKLPQVLRDLLMAKEKMLPLLQGERNATAEEQNRLAPKTRAELVGTVSNPFLIEDQIARDEGRLGTRLASIKDLEKNRSQTIQDIIDRAGTSFGTQVQAAKDEVGAAQTDFSTALQQAQAERQRQFEADQNERNRQNAIRTAQIAHSGSGGGITLSDLVTLQKNPLVAMAQAGYVRKPQPNGLGWAFYDKTGKPVSVDEVAGAIGSATGDLLAGSTNPADQRLIQTSSGKAPSIEAQKLAITQKSGNTSLDDLQTLLNAGISPKDMLLSRSAWSSLTASPTAKKYRTAARNIADAVARIRTGAAINDKEWEIYQQFIPGASDTPEVRNQKIKYLRQIFGAADGAVGPAIDMSAFEQ